MYSIYVGSKAPVEYFTRAARQKVWGTWYLSDFCSTGLNGHLIFLTARRQQILPAYHRSAVALNPFTKTVLTDIQDIAPLILFMFTDGWWIH
ncbi:MAG: hypothetical protein ABI045_06585 [Flavobacteriales bacterium]